MIEFIGNIEDIIIKFGYFALFAIVFAESGLFFGFFLPGDSLLFTAGLLVSKGILDLNIVLLGVAIFAILGDQVGYWMGAKYGRRFFSRPGSWIFNPAHVEKAEEFYNKHGKKTIVLARFVPAVRTFAPIVAGIAQMDYKTFITYNILGGVLWTLTMVLGGYFLGKAVPDAGKYIDYIIIGIIVLSVLPIAWEFIKAQKGNKPKAGKNRRWHVL